MAQHTTPYSKSPAKTSGIYHRINKNFVDKKFGGGVPGTHREVCIDKLTFDKRGNIIPVTPTLNGPEPLATKKQ